MPLAITASDGRITLGDSPEKSGHTVVSPASAGVASISARSDEGAQAESVRAESPIKALV
jgi:hypothetical protein